MKIIDYYIQLRSWATTNHHLASSVIEHYDNAMTSYVWDSDIMMGSNGFYNIFQCEGLLSAITLAGVVMLVTIVFPGY